MKPKFKVYMVSGVPLYHDAHLAQHPNSHWQTLSNGYTAYYTGEATEEEIEEAAEQILADAEARENEEQPED